MIPLRRNLQTWLGRLGVKSGAAPPYVDSIQPVSIVADERTLTPSILGPCGLVGTNLPPIPGEDSRLYCYCTAPMWSRFRITQPSATLPSEFGIRISNALGGTIGAVDLPANVQPMIGDLSTSTPYAVNGQRPGFANRWRYGSMTGGGLPQENFRFYAGTGYVGDTGWIHSPANSVLEVISNTLAAGGIIAGTFYELPLENEQAPES